MSERRDTMTDQKRNHEKNSGSQSDLSRRDFVAMSWSPGLAGGLRASAGDGRHREAHRGRGLIRAGTQSLLPRDKGAGNRDGGVQLPESSRQGEARTLDGKYQRGGRGRKGRSRLHRLPRRTAPGEQIEKSRHTGLLHGWSAGDEDGLGRT